MDSGVIPAVDQSLGLELARRHARLTQEQLAEQMGISKRTVAGYERAERAAKRPTLVTWAAVTGVSVEWLEGLEYTPRDSNPEPADYVFDRWVLAA